MPQAEELSEYYQSYLHYLRTDDMLDVFVRQRQTTHAFLARISTGKELHRYAPGKWSVREVAGHLCDSERIMAYRALCIARLDANPLPGFEENEYTLHSNYNDIPLEQIAAHLDAQRFANILLFRSFSPEMFDHRGTANNQPVTVRALLYFLIVHQTHHLGVIRDRYLSIE